MAKVIDILQKRMRGELPMPPLTSLLGMKFTSIQPGHIMMEYEFNEKHKAVDALCIGVHCTLADMVMSGAYNSTLEEGEFASLIEMKINFVKPARKGKLQATGKVLKGGRTLGLVECDILDDGQQLIAHAVGTCVKLESK